jgi:excisionase family DNA binding protein
LKISLENRRQFAWHAACYFSIGKKLAARQPGVREMASEQQSMVCEYLTVRQVAERLNVSHQLVYKLFHRGELLGITVAAAVRIEVASVEDFIRRNSNTRPAEQQAEPATVTASATPRPRRRKADDFTAYHLAEMDRIEAEERRRQKAKRS